MFTILVVTLHDAYLGSCQFQFEEKYYLFHQEDTLLPYIFLPIAGSWIR